MKKTTALAAAAAIVPMVLAGAATANAAAPRGRTTMDVVCDGQTLAVTTPSGNQGENWGAAQVAGDGHLVIASLEYAVYDDTAAMMLDDEVISHGRAHGQQRTTTCTVAAEQARLGDVAPPGFVYPSGTSATDLVTSSLRAVVVTRPGVARCEER
jgi:hypothetical protein